MDPILNANRRPLIPPTPDLFEESVHNAEVGLEMRFDGGRTALWGPFVVVAEVGLAILIALAAPLAGVHPSV